MVTLNFAFMQYILGIFCRFENVMQCNATQCRPFLLQPDDIQLQWVYVFADGQFYLPINIQTSFLRKIDFQVDHH